MPTAPTQYSIVTGTGGDYAAIVYKDANGGLATVTTPWYLNASGILVPAPTDANGNPQVSLTGSNIPLVADPPILIATKSYTLFTANATIFINSSTLHRNARERTFYVFNDLDQSVNVSIDIGDSTVNPNAIGEIGAPSSQTVGAHTAFTFSSKYFPALAANGDSISSSYVMGATGATTGNLYLYVVELF